MTVLHFIADSVYPAPGGMQSALLRIAKHFHARAGFRTVIYTRRQRPQFRNHVPEHGALEIVHLSERKDPLMEPRGVDDGFPDTLPNEYLLHSYQIELQLLQQEIEECLAKYSQARHVLISFFVTRTGFVAQHAALYLGLPHICSFRGSDYARDFVSPSHIQSIQFVVERADLILTSNRHQERQLSRAFPQANAFQ